MKTSFILVALAAFSSVLAIPLEDQAESFDAVDAIDSVDSVESADEPEAGLLVARANLPTLNSVQTKNARAIIAEVKKEKLGLHGCEAGITTALTESGIRILANKKVPKSLKYKHDGLGSDHDSIGIFQQRAMYYKDIKCDMGAACSASLFFKRMKGFKGWKTMDIAKLCQKVQVSALPDAYKKHTAAAKKICKAGGLK